MEEMISIMAKNTKKRYIEQYFKGIKPTELQQIEYTTPKEHKVKAMICRKQNNHLGSLLIFEVDKEPVEQFIQGMPNTYHFDSQHMISTETDYDFIGAYEKLDGTNICLYGLKDRNGELIEIVPKTRNRGAIDKKTLKLFEQCDTKTFTDHIRANPEHIIYLELYGMGNPREIKHIDTWLDVKLIGMYDGERFVKDNDLYLAYSRRPHTLFNIHSISQSDTEYSYYVNNAGMVSQYGAYISKEGKSCHNMSECIDYIRKSLDELNESYEKENHRLAVKGVVLNGINDKGELTYIKVSPTPQEKEEDLQ